MEAIRFLPVGEKPDKFSSHCNRCGNCCKITWMTQSPADLRIMSKRVWDKLTINREKLEDLIPTERDIIHIQSMFADRCLGKMMLNSPAENRWVVYYVYGPCKNLTTENLDGKEVPSCAIHETRPEMCSGYPYYKNKSNGLKRVGTDVSPYRGCTYNLDPTYGFDMGYLESAEFFPLDAKEI